MSKIKTVQQHILDEERLYPGATGDFTALLTSLTLAAKIISREVNQAGLVRILGDTGEINVHGEAVQKLDEFAQQTIYSAMGHSGHLCVMASEESEGIIPIPDGGKRGRYVLMFPLPRRSADPQGFRRWSVAALDDAPSRYPDRAA